MGSLYDLNHGGPYTIKLVASVGGGASAEAEQSFDVDKTPTVSISAPSGTQNAPFDIVGHASFKPTLSATKGSIYAYLKYGDGNYSLITYKHCDNVECDFSYQDITGNLYDLTHGGPYTIKLVASVGGGASAEVEQSFDIDKTPSVTISAPSGTLNAPFDIVGHASFKPTLSSTKGYIDAYLKVGDGNYGYLYARKNCETVECDYSYQEVKGSLLDRSPGAYTVKLVAYGGGTSAEAISTFIVTPYDKDKNLEPPECEENGNER